MNSRAFQAVTVTLLPGWLGLNTSSVKTAFTVEPSCNTVILIIHAHNMKVCAHLWPQTHLTQEHVKNNENALLITIQIYIMALIIWSCFKPKQFLRLLFISVFVREINLHEISNQTSNSYTFYFWFVIFLDKLKHAALWNYILWTRTGDFTHTSTLTARDGEIKRERSRYNQQNDLYCNIFAL